MATITVTGATVGGNVKNAITRLPNGSLATIVGTGSTRQVAYSTDNGVNWSFSSTYLPDDGDENDAWIDDQGRIHLVKGGTAGADFVYYLGTPNGGYTDWSWSSLYTLLSVASDEDIRQVEIHGYNAGSGVTKLEAVCHFTEDDETYGYDLYWYSFTISVAADGTVTKDSTPQTIRSNANEASSGTSISGFVDDSDNHGFFVVDDEADLGQAYYHPSGGSLATKGSSISGVDIAENILCDGTYIWAMTNTGGGLHLRRIAISDGTLTSYSVSPGTQTGCPAPRICFNADKTLIYLFAAYRTGTSPYYFHIKRYVFTIADGSFDAGTTVYDGGTTNTSMLFYSSTRLADNGIYLAYKAGAETYLKLYAENAAPNAPTDLTRGNYDARFPARYEWTFSDPNPGDTQSAFKLRIREQGTGTWYYAQSDGSISTSEVWVTSTDEYFDMDADALVNGKTYEWSVATKDAMGEAGSFATEVTFTTALVAVYVSLNSPATGHDVVDVPQEFEVYIAASDDSDCKCRLQVDTAATFDTANLIDTTGSWQDSETVHTPTATVTGTQTWYWRAKGIRYDNTESSWSETRTLDVDTGGALPTGYSPDPEGYDVHVIEAGTVTFTAIVDHVLTPTSGASLALQIELDDEATYTDPETDTSDKVLGGEEASVTVALTASGTYYIRFRTLADYGDDSAWDEYVVAVTEVTPFVTTCTWRRQTGPRPNRVYVNIEGGTTVKTAEVSGVDAAEKVDYWTTVPSTTSESEAQATADSILAVLQDRPIEVSGPIALTVDADFGRKVVAQWWEVDPANRANRIMREQAVLVLVRKVHDIMAGTTQMHLGDYLPDPDETIARILAPLTRA